MGENMHFKTARLAADAITHIAKVTSPDISHPCKDVFPCSSWDFTENRAMLRERTEISPHLAPKASDGDGRV